MCMKNNPEEECEVKRLVTGLCSRMETFEQRLDKVERTTTDGLATVNGNIETLSQQMTNMDARLVEEKQKWGEVLRNCVKWAVRGLVTVAVYAAGVNISKELFFRFFG